MRADGFDLRAASVEAPARLVPAGPDLLAVVPTSIVLMAPAGTLVQRSYLLGASADQGATWRFVDGAGLDRARAEKLFPELPADLTLPAKQEPALVVAP
jgi:hypothetical protein